MADAQKIDVTMGNEKTRTLHVVKEKGHFLCVTPICHPGIYGNRPHSICAEDVERLNEMEVLHNSPCNVDASVWFRRDRERYIAMNARLVENEAGECAVCFEPNKNGQWLDWCPKGHVFHKDCVAPVTKCPLCRTRLGVVWWDAGD